MEKLRLVFAVNCLSCVVVACNNPSSGAAGAQASAAPAPTLVQPATPAPVTPAPAAAAVPAAAPESTVKVSGLATFDGKVLVTCSDANPMSKPMQQPPTGVQFRSAQPGKSGAGELLRINFHNGYAKAPGEQVLGYLGQSKATASIEIAPREGAPFVTYFAVPEKTKVVLGADLKTATVKGVFSDAVDDNKTVTVEATVKCQ